MARVARVLNDLLGLPVTPGALDASTLWNALQSRTVQFQAVIQPHRVLSMVRL
jgi:hypothetical protein